MSPINFYRKCSQKFPKYSLTVIIKLAYKYLKPFSIINRDMFQKWSKRKMHKNPNQWLLSNETLKKENFKIKKVKKLDSFCRRKLIAKLLLQFFNDFFFFCKKKIILCFLCIGLKVGELDRMRVISKNIFCAGKLRKMWVTPTQCGWVLKYGCGTKRPCSQWFYQVNPVLSLINVCRFYFAMNLSLIYFIFVSLSLSLLHFLSKSYSHNFKTFSGLNKRSED